MTAAMMFRVPLSLTSLGHGSPLLALFCGPRWPDDLERSGEQNAPLLTVRVHVSSRVLIPRQDWLILQLILKILAMLSSFSIRKRVYKT